MLKNCILLCAMLFAQSIIIQSSVSIFLPKDFSQGQFEGEFQNGWGGETWKY